MNKLNPEIYVVCLASYNNGHSYGKWIDATKTPQKMQEEVLVMLSESPCANAEEWAIHSTSDLGDSLINEFSSFQTVSKIAQFILEHNKLGIALLEQFGGDLSYVKTAMEEHYLGEYKSEEDFAASFTEETNSVPEYLSCYVDYEKMARDYFIDSFFSVETDYQEVHVFFQF